MTGGYRRVFQKPMDFEWYPGLQILSSLSFGAVGSNMKWLSSLHLYRNYRSRKLLTYTDGDIPLVDTDLEIIAKSRPSTVVRREYPTNVSEEVKLPFNCTDQQKRPEKNASSPSTFDSKAEDGDREVEVPLKPTESFSNAEEAKTALQLSFILPSSCYATMAIRELLKTSTSVRIHHQSFTL